MIPVYVISRAVVSRCHTVRLLLNHRVPFTLVVDNDIQYKRALQMGCKKVLVSRMNTIEDTRNYINSANTGWYISLDDNIQAFSTLSDQYWDSVAVSVTDKSVNWRKEFRTPCSPVLFLERLEEVADFCRMMGTAYGGVSTTENPYFRHKRYSYRRFVKTKACVVDASREIVFKHAMAHDSYASALAVARYGRVVVNNYLFYKANWYENGGLGSRKMREEKGLMSQLESIVAEFPGLVGIAPGDNSALRFRLVTDKSVDNWRKINGYLPGRLL